MSRHAATKTRRSSSAESAYRAGIVSGTIDLSSPAAFTVRERLAETAVRNGAALAIVATTIWIYDVALVVRGG
jgi:hypothetical protein